MCYQVAFSACLKPPPYFCDNLRWNINHIVSELKLSPSQICEFFYYLKSRICTAGRLYNQIQHVLSVCSLLDCLEPCLFYSGSLFTCHGSQFHLKFNERRSGRNLLYPIWEENFHCIWFFFFKVARLKSPVGSSLQYVFTLLCLLITTTLFCSILCEPSGFQQDNVFVPDLPGRGEDISNVLCITQKKKYRKIFSSHFFQFWHCYILSITTRYCVLSPQVWFGCF